MDPSAACPRDVWTLIFAAVGAAYTPVLRLVCRGWRDRAVPPEPYEGQLYFECEAAYDGHLGLILWQEGLPERRRPLALQGIMELAALGGQEHCVDFARKRSLQTSTEINYELVILRASRIERPDLLYVVVHWWWCSSNLVTSLHPISVAFLESAERGHLGNLRRIVAMYPDFFPPKDENYDEAIHTIFQGISRAAAGGHLEALEWMLQDLDPWQNHRLDAELVEAAKGGHLNIMEFARRRGLRRGLAQTSNSLGKALGEELRLVEAYGVGSVIGRKARKAADNLLWALAIVQGWAAEAPGGEKH